MQDLRRKPRESVEESVLPKVKHVVVATKDKNPEAAVFIKLVLKVVKCLCNVVYLK